jgi:hypothetical protein
VPGLSLVASQELWLPYLEDLTGLKVCFQPGLMASYGIWLPYLEDLARLEVCIQPGLMASQEIWLPYLEDLPRLEFCIQPGFGSLKSYGFTTWRISRGWKSVPGLSLVASKQPRLLFGLLCRCLAAYSTAASRNGLKSWLST